MLRVARILAVTLALAAAPGTTAAQSLLQRSPNLWGGDVGVPGTLQVDASIRYRGAGDRELRTLPTVLAAYGLPANLLVGVSFAAQSPVSPGQSTEFELFVRWAPIVERADRPLQLVVQLAFNTATNSVDGELDAAYRLEAVRLLGAVRAFSDGFSDGAAFAALAGAAWHPFRGRVPVALAGDLGVLLGVDRGDDVIWSVGLQVGLPVSTSTLSFHVTNTVSGTLEGRSFASGRTRVGVEATIASPVGELLGIFVPREVAERAVQPVPSPAGRVARVDIREFAFVGERIVVDAGTTVVWTNYDEVVHTATSDDAAWNSGAIPPGGSWSATFNAPGTYSYHCGPHPYMRGTIVVR